MERPRRAAWDLAGRFATLSELLSAEPVVVADYVGWGPALALAEARLLMNFALGEGLAERTSLKASADAADFLRGLIGSRGDEALVVLYLDAAFRLIDYELIAEGRPDSVDFDQRRLLLRAMGRGATGIIVAHNHPSGDARPSQDDVRGTRRLAELGSALGIELRDHLVVTGKEVRSAMYA